MSNHLPPEHDRFAEALAAYAAGALDSSADRLALEDHLAGCEGCRAELASHLKLAEAIGRGIDPVAPPPALRSKVMTAATAAGIPTSALQHLHPAMTSAERRVPTRSGNSTLAWLTAAAAVIIAGGSLVYTVALQSEVALLTAMAAAAESRAETLNAEVVALRRQSSDLVQVLNVIGAPDVRMASLSGQGTASGALGRAYWSRTQGLVFEAIQLPAIAVGRDYQLWVVTTSGTPVSMGVLDVGPDGSSSHTTTLANLPSAAAVAVTVEPAGGSATPTLPIVMVGNLGT